MIREGLAGKRIAVTGTTGFLGTALLERLLRTVPDADLVLLLRPGRRSTVDQRARREIFRNDAFDRLRADVGGNAAFDAMIERRVTVIPGDASLGVGDSVGFRAELRDSGGNVQTDRPVAWFVSDSTVLSLFPFGAQAIVRARTTGTAVLSATSEGKTGRATITVH